MITSLWKNIVTIGVNAEQPIELVENIKNNNSVAIINIFLTIQGALFVRSLIPNENYHLPIIISGLCYLFVLILNYFQYFTFARVLPSLIAILSVFYVSSILGPESNVHTLFVIIIIGAMMAHSESPLKILVFLITLPVVCTSILILTDFSIFAPEIPVPRNIQTTISYNVFFINLTSSIVATFFYLRRTKVFKESIKRSKDELNEKYDELQKVNQEMDRFVYSVSHDLRAPIVSCLGLISLSLEEEEFEKVKYYLSLQEKSLWKLEKFIGEILVYSRNNRMELNIEKMDISQIIQEIIDSQNLAMETPPISIRTNFNIEYPIFSDKQRLTAILNNLISNAVRYRNKAINNAFIEITVESQRDSFQISIADNGLGIAEEHLPKIFEMFYRAHTRSEGSGLGLYIVKEVIDKLGGKISVNSELGKGTTFTCLIPNESI